jgi:hypothetical protein
MLEVAEFEILVESDHNWTKIDELSAFTLFNYFAVTLQFRNGCRMVCSYNCLPSPAEAASIQACFLEYSSGTDEPGFFARMALS